MMLIKSQNSPAFLPGPILPSVKRFPRPRLVHAVETQCSVRVAIARTVPTSLPSALLAPGIQPSDINVAVATAQHKDYVSILRKYCASVRVLPAADALPDSVFVEDAAVVVGGRAIQGVAGHASRAAEAALLYPTLRDIGVEVAMSSARLDGGDILQAGHSLFVGLSARTDVGAVDALCERFKCDVIPVDVAGGTLHLKCVVTWVQRAQSLVVQDSPVGRDVLRQMQEKTGRNWNVLWVPEEALGGANVLDLGDAVVLQQRDWEGLEEVRRDLKRAGVEPIPCDMSELAKANGALTCCSILV